MKEKILPMEIMGSTIENLAAIFAENVIAQDACIFACDHRKGNRHAKRYIKAFNELTKYGDAGREALMVLFGHDAAGVRVMAAAFLLRYRTREALDLLARESAGRGLAAFEAAQAIERWEEGSWSLDPGE